MADRSNFSLQIPTELLERIDANALIAAGGNRTQYLLSWLPENYEQPTTDSQTATKPAARDRR
jgi:hypothetical protein